MERILSWEETDNASALSSGLFYFVAAANCTNVIDEISEDAGNVQKFQLSHDFGENVFGGRGDYWG